MRNHLAGAIVLGLGLLAGCSSESQTNGQATVSAERAPGAQLPALATIRASAKSFASLPDRGELLSYDNMLNVKRRGAFTDYPVSISEAHALNAMASGEMVVNAPNGELVRLKYDHYEEELNGSWTWIGRDENGRSAVITFGDQAVFGSIPQSNGPALRLSTLNGHAWLVSTDSAKLSPGADQRTPAGAGAADGRDDRERSRVGPQYDQPDGASGSASQPRGQR